MRRLPLFALLVLGACSMLPPSSPTARYVVFFEQWSAKLDPPGMQALAAAAAAAQQHPGVPIVVTGYADPEGSPQANKDLSRLRAQMVIDTLVQDGVAAARITRRSQGSVVFQIDSLESRRVEIKLGGG